ncbi:CII family transcriptional regulator [Klebsiella variicola]|uniref:CII family transcriptional regulator n=1 Tax=Klebsiella variicola TaxID=244366 RepID=UPI00188EE450|nr:CII family transcriptional regulator [Klebsiella variicola]
MENSTARNKHQARQIETWLQNQIAIRGTTNVAKAMGLTKSTVSKWKKDWFPKVSLLLAVLEWGVADDDMSRLAKEVASLLKKEMAPKCSKHFEA